MARADLQGNRGFALLVVIVVMLLVSFLAAQLILQVRTGLKVAVNRSDHITERMLAEGGISLGLFRLRAEADEDTEELLGGPFRQGKKYESVFPAGKIEYYAVSETGKINLNGTSSVPLELFLEYMGLDVDEIAIVTDSLFDWRDYSDADLVRLNGAERDYYEELENPYIPRNGVIEDPGEFFMIRGTEKLRGMFDPYEVFTVHTVHNTDKINFNSLTPTMLDFLTQGSQEGKDLYWELKEETNILSTAQAEQILGPERYMQLKDNLVASAGVNLVYTVVATGMVRNLSAENEDSNSTGGADADDEGGRKRKKGVNVRTMVNAVGGKISYLSWRISYT